MAVFKWVATWELVVLLVQFLLGNSFLLLHASPDCCSDLLYPRVVLLGGSLLLTTVAAATILLSVLMAVHAAEAKPAAAYKHGLVYKAVSSAQTSAYKQGVAASGWKLRALLLLAIGLSAVSTFLAVPTFETGYGYRKGCVYSRHPLAVGAMVMLAIEHGCAAFLVAVAQE